MEMPCSSSEGRRLVAPIVATLHAFGARVRQIGVYPTTQGLLFVADINGRVVSAQTQAGTVAYATVATDLLAATLQPTPEEQ
jgi:hypothetical protein